MFPAKRVATILACLLFGLSLAFVGFAVSVAEDLHDTPICEVRDV